MNRTCCKCNDVAIKSLGTTDLCGDHLAELYSRFTIFPPATTTTKLMCGVAIQTGLARPDHGDGYAHVECNAPDCSATWVGRVGDPCPWCIRAREVLVEHQRSLLLSPPERMTDEAMAAWGRRLSNAVDSKIITRAEARSVWRRAVIRYGAA